MYLSLGARVEVGRVLEQDARLLFLVDAGRACESVDLRVWRNGGPVREPRALLQLEEELVADCDAADGALRGAEFLHDDAHDLVGVWVECEEDLLVEVGDDEHVDELGAFVNVAAECDLVDLVLELDVQHVEVDAICWFEGRSAY